MRVLPSLQSFLDTPYSSGQLIRRLLPLTHVAGNSKTTSLWHQSSEQSGAWEPRLGPMFLGVPRTLSTQLYDVASSRDLSLPRRPRRSESVETGALQTDRVSFTGLYRTNYPLQGTDRCFTCNLLQEVANCTMQL